MNIIRNFTLKSLARNKKRTAVTIIGVIISVAMLTAVTVFISSLISMVQRSTIADGGDWHVEMRNVQAENINTVTGGGIVTGSCLSRDLGYAPFKSTKGSSKQYFFIRQYSSTGFNQMSVKLTSGRLPQASGEVLVSDSIEKGSGIIYKPGDTITLEIGSIVYPDGTTLNENAYMTPVTDNTGKDIGLPQFVPEKTESFTVTGIMQQPTFEQSWSAGYGVLGYLDQNSLAPGDTVNIYLSVSPLSRGIYDTVPSLAQQAGVPSKNITYNDELLRYYGIVSDDNVYSFITNFVIVIILIIVLASVAFIYNAFAISVSERAKQLGLLASVGATRRQKRASVYFEGLLIGAIGIPVGILAGIAGIAITLAAIRPLLDSFMHFTSGVELMLIVPPELIALTVVLSALTIYISLLIPARRASRITPIDAIRLTKEVRLTRKAVKTSRITRSLFGFEAELALKNLKRSRKKYRATILSLAISIVLFLTVATYTGLMTFLSGTVNEGVNYDIGVIYSGAAKAQAADLNSRITSLEGVKGYSFTSELSSTAMLDAGDLSDYTKMYVSPGENGRYDFSINLVCLDGRTFADYVKAVGADISDYMDQGNPKAILINHGQDYSPKGDSVIKTSGDILNVSAGRKLSVIPSGSSSGASLEFSIGAVTDERPMGTFIQSFYSATAVMSAPVFEKLTEGLSAADKEQLITNSLYIMADDDQQLQAQINNITGSVPPGMYVLNEKSAARAEQNFQLFLGIFVYGFIILINMICIANIFNTVTTNIALRRREFAMLRSVGMTPGDFNKMIRFESIFYGLKGLLYGLPISFAIGLLLNKMQQGVLRSGIIIPWISYGIAVFMILVIVFVTMAYSTHKIKKENIIEALREESA